MYCMLSLWRLVHELSEPIHNITGCRQNSRLSICVYARVSECVHIYNNRETAQLLNHPTVETPEKTSCYPPLQFSHSVVSDSLGLHESQHARPPLSITNSQSSLRLTSIESVMPSSHLILCRPLLLLPPIPPTIRVFSNKSTLHMMWPKYWSFSFSIISSEEIPGLITFRMDWLDLLAVQGTLKSLLQ